ncbi:hypothetical protein RCS94_08460 [Orbaceae bacterium ac157xtp]
MLKFIDISPELNNNVEIDYYVPFTVEVKGQNFTNENSLYWRTGNFDTSLLEIGIGEKSGILKSITLTMVNQVDTNNANYEVLDIRNATPIFDISMMKNQIFDYISEYYVSLTVDDITVRMSQENRVKTIFRMGRIDMGFGFENELIFIKVSKLFDREYKELAESFKL